MRIISEGKKIEEISDFNTKKMRKNFLNCVLIILNLIFLVI